MRSIIVSLIIFKKIYTNNLWMQILKNLNNIKEYYIFIYVLFNVLIVAFLIITW